MKRSPWRAVWQQRPERERRLLVLGAIVVGAAALWQWGLAPALATWRAAPLRQAELDRQTQEMLQLQAQARQLQPPARIPRPQAIALLEASASQLLGPETRLNVQGEQLRVQLVAAPASGLTAWLAQAREKAQAMPQNVRIQRSAEDRTGTSKQAPSPARWSGDILLRLP